MEKFYIVKYKKDSDGLSALIVADPDITLPNGNKKVVKILIGSYADDILKELIEDKGKND